MIPCKVILPFKEIEYLSNHLYHKNAIKPRRLGDIAICYCNPAKAKAELGREAQYGIEEMCRDSWNWQKNNMIGFSK